jgi:hypothetical protein
LGALAAHFFKSLLPSMGAFAGCFQQPVDALPRNLIGVL